MEKKYDPEKDGGLNREDSGAEKRPRKSTASEESVSSPFAKDKRPRIRRVTEQLNERTPHPRVERDREERRPSDSSGDNRPRRSFNPNFDNENRPKFTPRRDRNEGAGEEDNRFNSYKYDRERPPREDRYNRDDRSPRSSAYPRRDDKPYTPRTGNNDRPRYDRDQQERPRYDRDNQGERPRYDREERPRYNREGSDDRRDNRSSRPYPQRDDRPRTDRFNKERRDSPFRDNRRDNRPSGGRKDDPFKTPKGGYDSEYKPKIYPAYAAANIAEPIRLNKYISMSGLCSRREADEFIKQGEITVNGAVITEMGYKIDPSDEVRYNGEVLQGEKRVYILMNKPKGFVTTVEDPNADRTVMDIVKNACQERVYPVGRLDKNSLGVLLITNDGELTKKLTHPSHEKRKVYQVALDRAANVEDLEKLYEGIPLEDGMAKVDDVDFLDPTRREVGITIHTGRNRIVRRMFEELGYHVQKLDRVYFAGLTKKGLRRGAWRYLTPKEVAMLKSGNYE